MAKKSFAYAAAAQRCAVGRDAGNTGAEHCFCNRKDGYRLLLTGPYLMTPKTNGMVVVWELDKPMKSTITYGTERCGQENARGSGRGGRKV